MKIAANNKQKSSGFTIIEVVLVIAIVGFIMIILFIALPQLQRNIRDHQRKNLANTIFDALDAYAGSHNDTYPWGSQYPDIYNDPSCKGQEGTFCDFYQTYVKGKINDTDPLTGESAFYWEDPSAPAHHSAPDADPCEQGIPIPVGQPCSNVYGEYPPTWWEPGGISIITEAKCQNNLPVSSQATPALEYKGTSFALVMGLERSHTYYCISSGF
jgi:type II secretory pathway pseudopilin PulG